MKGPLQDLLVIELASVLAGPSVGTFLAELGARVIKIENPHTGGDVTRSWKLPVEKDKNARSAYYSSVNWGKEVLFHDLKHEQQRQRVYDLIREADVVLSSFRPGADVHLGMDPVALSDINPQLIYARITGFGPTSARPAFDVVLQAETGWMSMNGTANSGPLKIPVALMDVLASHQLKEGLLLALLQREKTAKGALVEVSLYDAALSGLVNQASNYLMCGHIPGPIGSLHPNIAPYGETFICKDSAQIVLAVGTDSQFRSLCRILGADKVLSNALFKDNTERVKNRGKLHHALKSFFAKESATHWTAKFEAAFVPAGKIQKLDEVFGKAEARKMVLSEHTADGSETLRVAGKAFRIAPLK